MILSLGNTIAKLAWNLDFCYCIPMFERLLSWLMQACKIWDTFQSRSRQNLGQGFCPMSLQHLMCTQVWNAYRWKRPSSRASSWATLWLVTTACGGVRYCDHFLPYVNNKRLKNDVVCSIIRDELLVMICWLREMTSWEYTMILRLPPSPSLVVSCIRWWESFVQARLPADT